MSTMSVRPPTPPSTTATSSGWSTPRSAVPPEGARHRRGRARGGRTLPWRARVPEGLRRAQHPARGRGARPGSGGGWATPSGVPAIAADVHVQRVVHRLGWCPAEHPAQAEAALSARFPPQQWVRAVPPAHPARARLLPPAQAALPALPAIRLLPPPGGGGCRAPAPAPPALTPGSRDAPGVPPAGAIGWSPAGALLPSPPCPASSASDLRWSA